MVGATIWAPVHWEVLALDEHLTADALVEGAGGDNGRVVTDVFQASGRSTDVVDGDHGIGGTDSTALSSVERSGFVIAPHERRRGGLPENYPMR